MLKKKIEALLFSSGRKMSVPEIAGLCNNSVEDTKRALNELKEKFDEDSSLMLFEEGDSWKIMPKEDYLHLVRKVVTQTELTKTLMETLAVIAFKYPIKQSELIKVRTNKAYDHLKELEEMGYITRKKYGRTKLIKLTNKFFDYFSLKEENLKDRFKDFESIAQKIEDKENEIKEIKESQKKMAKEAKEKSKELKGEIVPEVDLVDKEGKKVKLDIVDESAEDIKKEESAEVSEYKDKLGNLEVVDEEPAAEKPEGESSEEESEDQEEADEDPEEVKAPEESDDEVNKRVEELLHPAKEETDSEEETELDAGESQGEPIERSDDKKSEETPEDDSFLDKDSEEDASDKATKKEQDFDEDSEEDAE